MRAAFGWGIPFRYGQRWPATLGTSAQTTCRAALILRSVYVGFTQQCRLISRAVEASKTVRL